MKNLNHYIFEKLHLNKDIDINKPPIEDLENVIIATFVQCARDKNYKESSTFKKTIYRSRINYEYIVNFLNANFNYKFEWNPLIYNKLETLVKINISYIEALLNFKRISLKLDEEHVYLDGNQLYKKYFNVIAKKTKY